VIEVFRLHSSNISRKTFLEKHFSKNILKNILQKHANDGTTTTTPFY